MVQKDKLVCPLLYFILQNFINHYLPLKESCYGRPIILADRELVELDSDEILRDADKEDVSFLVVGDPFGCVPSVGSH